METLEREQLRELDHRVGDGFEVTLLWSEDGNELKVVVKDWRTEEEFEIPARADNALDVFNHPFAYRWRNLAGMTVRFVAVGELLVDVVAEGSGHDARIRVQPGGSAFNAATTAAAAGAEAAVIGSVGDDPAGHMILAELEAHGVRAEVAVAGGRTGVFVLAGGEIRVDQGASRAVNVPESIGADAVLVSGHLPAGTIAHALARAQAAWVALDAARLTELPPAGNVLIANEDAARRLTGEAPEEAARTLGQRYRLACVTRGAQGAVAVLDGTIERAPAAGTVAGDPPGAGDAFAAVLLVRLARGDSLADALTEACRWGAQAAAIRSLE